MGFEQSDELFRSDDIGFEINEDLDLDDGELTGLPTVKVPKRSARERVEVKQGIRRDRLGRPTDEDGEGDMVAPVRGVRLSGGAAGGRGFGAPMMSESSEFGYLFNDDEPTDEHMDEKRAERLSALAYDEAHDGDGEQYDDIFSADAESEPMVRRRGFNRRKSESRTDAEGSQANTAPSGRGDDSSDKKTRFARRSKSDNAVQDFSTQESESPKPSKPEPQLPMYNPIPEIPSDNQMQPIPAPQMTEGGEAYIQPAPMPDMFGQPPYGMYPQPPYPPMPYPQYGMSYMPPYQSYPPYQQGYPQVPYPAYMPMPYAPAPSVVVIPPVGGYYDPYEQDELYEARRRRRRMRDEYDDYGERYPEGRRPRREREYDYPGEEKKEQARPVFNEPVGESAPYRQQQPAKQPTEYDPSAMPPPSSFAGGNLPSPPRTSRRSTENIPEKNEQKPFGSEGSPEKQQPVSPRFNKRGAADSASGDSEQKPSFGESAAEKSDSSSPRFNRRGSAESTPAEKEQTRLSAEDASEKSEPSSPRFNKRGATPGDNAADEAKFSTQGGASADGNDDTPSAPRSGARFNRR